MEGSYNLSRNPHVYLIVLSVHTVCVLWNTSINRLTADSVLIALCAVSSPEEYGNRNPLQSSYHMQREVSVTIDMVYRISGNFYCDFYFAS